MVFNITGLIIEVSFGSQMKAIYSFLYCIVLRLGVKNGIYIIDFNDFQLQCLGTSRKPSFVWMHSLLNLVMILFLMGVYQLGVYYFFLFFFFFFWVT